MSEVRVIVYGIGAVGRDLVIPLLKKGVKIVGAIDVNPDLVGRDLGDIVGWESPIGVKVSDDTDRVVEESGADVALLCMSTDLTVMRPHFERCLKQGINIVTATDGVGYPWRIAPDMARELDALAKENGVSLLSSGWQDPYTIHLCTFLAGTCYEIDSIEMTLTSNLNHVGRAETELSGVGLSKQEIEALLANPDMGAHVSKIVEGKSAYMEAVTGDMGLTTRSIRYWAEPVFAEQDTYSPVLDKVIEKGRVIGSDMKSEILTEEGVTYLSTMRFVVYPPGELDLSPVEVKIKGNPDVHFIGQDIDIHTHVCQAIVNRVPDAINATPGLVTNEKMPKPRYRSKPFSAYIQ